MNELNLKNPLTENNLIPFNPENGIVIYQEKMENTFKRLCEILAEIRVILASLETRNDQEMELMEGRDLIID